MDCAHGGAPIPSAYGQTYIALIPRDPYWMFSYWEVTDSACRHIKGMHGEDIFIRSQAMLRMHQVSFESGIPQSFRFFDVAVTLDAKNWYLRADRESSAWFVELGIKTQDGRFIVLAKSNIITLPAARVSDTLDEKWVTLKDDLEKILTASGRGKVGQGSLELARMLHQRWEMLAQISSWMGSGGVSSLAARQEKKRSFWLTADCELILYGATESSASVTVADKPVQLAPDGTFSLRFALPDGDLELPVKAISGDREEERWIKISVYRKTEKG
jgi:hypothetical protein